MFETLLNTQLFHLGLTDDFALLYRPSTIVTYLTWALCLSARNAADGFAPGSLRSNRIYPPRDPETPGSDRSATLLQHAQRAKPCRRRSERVDRSAKDSCRRQQFPGFVPGFQLRRERARPLHRDCSWCRLA